MRKLLSLHTRMLQAGALRLRLGVVASALALVTSLLVLAAPPALAAVGSVPPAPTGSVDLGAAPTSMQLQLEVALQPSDPAGMNALAAAIGTPGSPDYRHFLAPGQFAALFGASPAEVGAVQSALRSQGLPAGTLSADRLFLAVDTTAGVADVGLGAQERSARLASGRLAFRNAAAPTLPATVAPLVRGVSGLDSLAVAQPQLARGMAEPAAVEPQQAPAALPAASGPAACAAAANLRPSPTNGHVPADIAQAYSISGLYGAGDLGAGQTVALLELSHYSTSVTSDIATYQSCFQTSVPIADTLVSGGSTDTTDALEVDLDAEQIIGIAPAAGVHIYEAPNTSAGILAAYQQMVSDDTAKTISTSWGVCERDVGSLASMEDTVFTQAQMQGQSVFAASGDGGSEDCPGSTSLYVGDPASQRYVTGVGGTSWLNGGPPSEAVWNNSPTKLQASGGGDSIITPLPSWQDTTYGLSQDAPSPAKREVPDVSALADPQNGYVIYNGGAWGVVAGTSAAAPLWASITALANVYCQTSLGFLNPQLYSIAASSTGGAFSDVTSGNNDITTENPPKYMARVGYDLATGIGTPIAFGSPNALVERLCPTSAPAWKLDSPPGGAAGTAYSYTFNASGGPAPTYAVASGTLPPGLSLNGTTGVLSGTPTTGGAFTFVVAATNSSGTVNTGPLNVAITQAPAFTADSPPASATNGAPYDNSAGYTFAASGYPAPTFAVASGSLPPGLSLGSGGLLSGTPTSMGPFTFAVSASNSSGSATSQSHTITVTNNAAFVHDSPPLTGALGAPYSYTFTAAGVPTPTFALASGSLPPGLSLDPGSGVLSGTPTAVGSFTFAVVTTNSGGSMTSPSFTVVISQAPAFTADTPPAIGHLGQVWVYPFAATGSPAPTFALASGSLPPGLSLNATTGVLAGYPSKNGVYTFSIAASNNVGSPAVTPQITVTITGASGKGYWEVASDGGLFSFGDAPFYGSAGGIHLNQPIVGMAATVDEGGYWEVASDGGLFSYGDAAFHGSAAAIHLNKPVVGLAGTIDGGGYWEVATDGGLFSYGNAPFFGSAGAIHLNKPIVGMQATPDGGGYWEVASDGGLFSYGDAPFFGSAGAIHLNSPIVGMVATPDGAGYWEVAADGGLFSYGDAGFYGSAAGGSRPAPIVGMVATPDGKGYWEVGSDGSIYPYGDATSFGSMGGKPLNKPIVALVGH